MTEQQKFTEFARGIIIIIIIRGVAIYYSEKIEEKTGHPKSTIHDIIARYENGIISGEEVIIWDCFIFILDCLALLQ